MCSCSFCIAAFHLLLGLWILCPSFTRTGRRLKGLNLVGVLPVEFANLTQLQELDLTYNLINGSIPKDFARIPLLKFSIIGNRLSGEIPPEIGNIASLEELILEDNQIRGTLPKTLGKLIHLRRLQVSSNNIRGLIPQSFWNLRNLSDFRVDGTNISGNIPEFIGNWTNLQTLYIQGTSMENPIPTAISHLKNLTQLVISDLKGGTVKFPNLSQLTSLQRLVLRNCLIEDRIPEYIGSFNDLRILDLSFNRLSGSIPDTFQNLFVQQETESMFLTNNSLSGQIPSWIAVISSRNIDLSYNNFNEGLSDFGCTQSNNINLISSLSAKSKSDSWCQMKDLPCSREPQRKQKIIDTHTHLLHCSLIVEEEVWSLMVVYMKGMILKVGKQVSLSHHRNGVTLQLVVHC
uniref:Disease resistance R13L4/SHOC-2-like LRR domain-containing protein n=1 Tax=Cucumis sativus TaxID=3659 RepID=A0A0A0L387_CUCSA